MALLPRIAAGEPIDDMQAGQSTWLRNVFYDNGSLATGGGAYFDNLGNEDKVQFLEALRLRRQVFRQRAEAGTSGAPETSQLVARLYESAYTEIAPVLDRYALNDKMNDLAAEAPSLKRYMTQTGPRPGSGEAWVGSLSHERQTRVRDAVADRNAIRNIGGQRLVAASKVLADPANGLSVAAARIDRSEQDLERLFNDSGLTDRGTQYLSRLPQERAATIQYNFQLRNSRRAAMPSPAFSLSVPATPASQSEAELNLDAWRAQLMGQPAHASPVPAHSPEASFAMPQTPSGGWGWDLNSGADAGPSNWHDEAASAAPAYSPESSFAMPQTPSGGWTSSLNTGAEAGPPNWQNDVASAAPHYAREFSLSVPATPSSGADSHLGLDAWNAQLTGQPAHGSPARTYSTEPSFAVPQTPSGGWEWDLNSSADAGPSNWHDEAASAAPPYSREFSLSLPATPAEGAGAGANLNLAEWHEHLMGGPRDPFVALLPSIEAGIPIDQIQDGRSTWLRHFISEEGDLLPNGRARIDLMSNDDKARVLDGLERRRQAYQRRTACESAFSEISPFLDRFALNEKVTDLAEEAPTIRRYLAPTGLNPRRGESWLANLSENAQARVRAAIADRTAIQNLGRYLVQISELLADPNSDLPRVAARLGGNLEDLQRLFNDSGLTERGAQYVARLRPERQAQILQNMQLRYGRREAIPASAPESSFAMPAMPSGRRQRDLNAGEGPSHRQYTAPHAFMDPHAAELRSILDDIGRVPLSALQYRVSVPLDEYFVPDEGITEKGFQFLKTLSELQQMNLQLALSIPRDVMTFHEINALIERYEAGVAGAALRREMPNLSSYLTDSGGFGARGGRVWFRNLRPDRQARIARAMENRQIIIAIGPHFLSMSSTFSNPANDMESVARRASASVEQVRRFLTEEGLTPLGQRFVETCDPRTRQLIEANIALRLSRS